MTVRVDHQLIIRGTWNHRADEPLIKVDADNSFRLVHVSYSRNELLELSHAIDAALAAEAADA